MTTESHESTEQRCGHPEHAMWATGGRMGRKRGAIGLIAGDWESCPPSPPDATALCGHGLNWLGYPDGRSEHRRWVLRDGLDNYEPCDSPPSPSDAPTLCGHGWRLSLGEHWRDGQTRHHEPREYTSLWLPCNQPDAPSDSRCGHEGHPTWTHDCTIYDRARRLYASEDSPPSPSDAPSDSRCGHDGHEIHWGARYETEGGHYCPEPGTAPEVEWGIQWLDPNSNRMDGVRTVTMGVASENIARTASKYKHGQWKDREVVVVNRIVTPWKGAP